MHGLPSIFSVREPCQRPPFTALFNTVGLTVALPPLCPRDAIFSEEKIAWRGEPKKQPLRRRLKSLLTTLSGMYFMGECHRVA